MKSIIYTQILHELLAATTSESQILDFRMQIEGCLMQAGYLCETRIQLEFPPARLSSLV